MAAAKKPVPRKQVKAGYKGAPKKGGEGGNPYKIGETYVVAKRKTVGKARKMK